MNIETMTCTVYEDGAGGLWRKDFDVSEEGELVRLETTIAALRARGYVPDMEFGEDHEFNPVTGLRQWHFRRMTPAQKAVVASLAGCGFTDTEYFPDLQVVRVNEAIRVDRDGAIRVRVPGGVGELRLAYAAGSGFTLMRIMKADGFSWRSSVRVESAAAWLRIARQLELPACDIATIVEVALDWAEALEQEYAELAQAHETHGRFIMEFCKELKS